MNVLPSLGLACALIFAPAPGTVVAPPPAPVLTKTIPLPAVEGRIDHMAWDAAGKRLYIAALGNGSLEVVDADKGERIKSIGGLKEPQGVVFVPAAKHVVVSSGGDGSVRTFDAAGFEQTRKVSVGDDADNARLDVDHGELVVGYGNGGLAFLDAKSLEVKGTVKLPGHPESFQVEPATGRVFVNVPSAAAVVVVDGPKRAVTAIWKLDQAGGNFPMALDTTNKRLYIGCRRAAKLLVIDTDTGHVIASPVCVGDADDIFVDAKTGRVLVTGGDGKLDVFTTNDHKSYTRAETVATAPGARTSLFVPESRTLFVAAPKRDGKDARLLVFSLSD